MKLRVRILRLRAGKPIAFIHDFDAAKMAIHSGDRVLIRDGHIPRTAIVDIASGLFKRGEVALSEELSSSLKVRSGSHVDVSPALMPASARILQAKNGHRDYTQQEIKSIISDIVNDVLSEAEIAYFVSGVYHHGLSAKETLYLTQAIYETGTHLKWRSPYVADKHSIGGIPGNRTTPIVVSICAAAGILMPKTSSRAITSAAGTADTIETIAKVDFSLAEIRKIVERTGACLAWGGALGLAPADDKLIQVEKRLNLDPEPQLLASILSKKLAVGSKYVLIDIPYGSGAKVSRAKAIRLKRKFISLGKKLGLHINVVLTPGNEPIGNGIGALLEIKDVLRVLRRDSPPKDLENKSVLLAGILLEMLNKASKGKGKILARKILEDGRAFAKFKEIILAQQGHLDELPEARLHHTILAKTTGRVSAIYNKDINHIARILGCPQDKTAGIYLHKHTKDKISKRDPLLTLYSESEIKLKAALAYIKESHPIELE